MSEFYDENYKTLKYSPSLGVIERLLMRKIEDCYELCLGYDQYEEEKEEMMQYMEAQAKLVASLVEKVGKLEDALKEAEKQ